MFINGGRRNLIKKLQWIARSWPRLLLLIMVITRGNTASAQQNQQNGFECNEEGYQQDPRSCSIYYRCVNWGNGTPLTKFKFECGPGTVFSHAKGDICVHPRESERSECSESANDLDSVSHKPSSNEQTGPPAAYPDYPSYGSPLPGTPSSELSSTTSGAFESTMNPRPTSNNYPGSVHGQDNGGSQCQQEGFKPDERDCRKFIRCVSNGAGGYQRYEFTCGEGTVWDPSIEACNHAWAVSKSNCGEMSNGGSNVGGGNEGSNEQSGYPGSSGEPGYTEESESNEVPRPPGGYPQGTEVSTAPGGPLSGYPQYPNQGYPQNPSETAGSPYPSDSGPQRPQGPSAPHPPPPSGYPQNPPETASSPRPSDFGPQRPQGPSALYPPPPPSTGYPSSRPDERPSQQGDSSPGSFYPPPYPGVPPTQPDKPSTSESSELPGTTESPEEGSSRPPGGLYPPPPQNPGEATGASGLGRPKPDASGSCTEEGFFPDPSDCKKFYRCVEGEGSYQKYEFTCGEGTAWDQALLTCNHDYAVPGCGSSAGSERPGGTETEGTPSSSSNEVTSEPDGNQQPTSAPVDGTSSGGTTAESSGTTVSSQSSSNPSTETSGEGTTEGAREPDTTSEGSTSSGSSTSSESSTASESPSEGTSSASTVPSSGTSSSPTTASSPDGSSTTSKPDEGSGGSTPSKPSGSCGAEGFFADPNDCHKFYRCVSFDHSSKSFTKFKFNCGPGTAWDQNLQTCNYEDQVESCEGSGGSKPSSEGPDESMNEIESSAKPSGSSEGTTPSSAGTEESSTPAATTDSSEGTTPSSSETEETPTSAATTESSEATTSSSSETEETSTPAAITESSEATTQPSTETEGSTPLDMTQSTPDISSEATTPPGSTDSSTEEPEDTSTTTSVPSTTPGSEPSSSSPGGATSSSQPSSSKFKCTDEGFFPNPSDCHKFIRCVKVNNGFIKYEFDCGPGTAWDQNLQTCNYEAQVESCEAGGSPTTESSSTESSSSSTESSETTEPGASTESSTTSGDQSTSPEGTEGTTEGSTGAESTTAGGEGETTPPGGEETTTGTDETPTTEGTGGTEETGGTEGPETTDSTPAVPPGAMAAPCAVGNLTDEQIVLVCPTGFRRHPKFCNMFYQCTSQGNMEIKILVMVCPEGTIFDDKKVQCLAEGETDQQCMSPTTSSRFYRQLEDTPISPIRVTRSTLCPDEGHYPYREGCSNAFYKCKRNSRNSLEGYLYKCPKDFVYWSVSRRCERASRLPMCSQVEDENNERRHAWESRSNLPIEEFNLSARSLKI
ncbi:flocculation protein FLO11 [Diachasma alloeum]|uniref:flocculation protein FLO11 n=1 Tax=Diachasma alloeum TaxID=454923 RepID=UPI000738176C|nr:flocculation protein FLO11 [Diachasma alloeum]